METFKERVLQFWTAAITNVAGNNPPMSATWRGTDSICTVLRPFMAESGNHAHLPTGGGMDIEGVDYSVEPDCLEIRIGQQSAWVIKPESLVLEYFPESPIDSFMLLELTELQASGVYEQQETKRLQYVERLVEPSPGSYVERDVWDNGFFGYDEQGDEIPLPDESRLVNRWLRGNILIVAKGSRWNNIPATYDGRHNAMKAVDIRKIIADMSVRGAA